MLFLGRSLKSPFEFGQNGTNASSVRNEKAREILLGADYFLRLHVGKLPDGTAANEYEQTGLKWLD